MKTGKKQYKRLAEFIAAYSGMAQTKDITGVAIVCTTPAEETLIDAMILPDGNREEILKGLKELRQRLQQNKTEGEIQGWILNWEDSE